MRREKQPVTKKKVENFPVPTPRFKNICFYITIHSEEYFFKTYLRVTKQDNFMDTVPKKPLPFETITCNNKFPLGRARAKLVYTQHHAETRYYTLTFELKLVHTGNRLEIFN